MRLQVPQYIAYDTFALQGIPVLLLFLMRVRHEQYVLAYAKPIAGMVFLVASFRAVGPLICIAAMTMRILRGW